MNAPLRPAQRRLWFLDRAGHGTAYLIWHAYRLTGPLDEAVLEAALLAVVKRHDALRSVVAEHDGEPVWVIGQHTCAPLIVHEAGCADEAARIAGRIAQEPLDLEHGPLFRVGLVRTGPEEHLLVLTFHHIVCDGPSIGVVLRDLWTCYRALLTGREPGLPALPAPVAADQEPAATQSARAYWKASLTGAPPLLELPADRPRRFTAGRGARHPVRLERQTAAAVLDLARRERCTPFMVLLAAAAVMMARHSGQDDIVIGAPATGADRPGPDAVGMFVNTLALRVDLSGDPTARELLRQARRSTLGGLQHQGFPFDELVAELDPGRGSGHNPLFQAMLVVEHPPGAEEPAPGLSAVWQDLTPETTRFDLTLLGLVGTERDLELVLDYSADLFDPGTAAGFAASLVRILKAMAADPACRVWDIPLAEPSLTAVREEWTRPVHEQFAARAATTPEAPALAGESVLAYGALERRANQLAHRLHDLGVGPGSPVAVVLPAGAQALVAVLGVLKAGGAYVPLDPAQPAERLGLLIAESGARTVIGHGGLTLGEGEADEPPARPVGPGDLAYIVFTSGSTGRPKGVMVTHGTLAELTRSFREVHECFEPGQRVLMLPPLTFDASVGDLFPALTGGAALVLHPDPAALDGPELVRWCVRHGVTAVDAPSSLWQQWVHDLRDLNGTTVEWPVTTMMVGGDRVPVESVRAFSRLTGGTVALFNHYGPTEATVCATVLRTVDAAEFGELSHLPIGRPLPHVRAHVLDGRGGPVPSGTPGELHLGGACLARGYLGEREATDERFVPDPFAGGRMYRTGDLARERADGTLEFLGRADRQVKINGYRVEPAEVEAAALACPGVRDAVVVAAQGRLVAYTAGGAHPGDVRRFLLGRLPRQFVPAVVVSLGEIPRTAHGKPDLALLPAAHEAAPVHEAPRGSLEHALAEAWRRATGAARVGRGDSFFALGGSSLVAVRMLREVERSSGVRLTLAALFETADLAEFAASAGRAGQEPDAAGLRARAVLPRDLRTALRSRTLEAPRTGDRAAAPRAVLLTGATGFLGSFLLAELLRQGAGHVYCLVRPTGTQDPAARLRQAMTGRGLRDPATSERITVLPGDLTQPSLGLVAERYEALAGETDLIVHYGRHASFAQPYRSLEPVNVGGTLEVLRLAAHRRLIPVHAVTTLGLYAAGQATVTEGRPPDEPEGLDSPYYQSRWVADALVRAAREHGLPAAIHRPARVGGASGSGICDPGDYFSRLLRTCRQLGLVPDLAGGQDAAPVDHVAAGIVRLALDPGSTGRDYHYANPKTISSPELAAALGAELVPWRRWQEEVDARDDAAMAAFAGDEQPWGSTVDRFDCAATVSAAGLRFPPLDSRLIGLYLETM
ncbi:amino acid adenylation domain-containing protein [Nonomuraea sp. NPDC050663]|uniref:amino acid adenylation domain-containing protein n=1 Tax=Nonomuraea sp. NPDC050663 TaxID=3364370 RepID=UPI0037BC1647